MKKQLTIIVFACALVLGSMSMAVAQPDFEDDVNDIPIDGGITLLLAAGAALGGKKIYDASKKQDK